MTSLTLYPLQVGDEEEELKIEEEGEFDDKLEDELSYHMKEVTIDEGSVGLEKEQENKAVTSLIVETTPEEIREDIDTGRHISSGDSEETDSCSDKEVSYGDMKKRVIRSALRKRHSQLRQSARKSHKKLPTSTGRRGHKNNRLKVKQALSDW